jgi:hypothetical protein
MLRRLVLTTLLIVLPASGCKSPQRDVRPDVSACADADPCDSRPWLPFSGEDGQYGALVCVCYALILAAAAAGAWWAVAAAQNQRGDFP